MTIQEMHTLIQQDIQKINSSALDNFLPQEIDLVLNKCQTRFIKEKFTPDQKNYFEDSLSSSANLSSIIKKVYIPVTDSICILPPDFYYYISSRSHILNNCEEERKIKIKKTLHLSLLKLPFTNEDVVNVNGFKIYDNLNNLILSLDGEVFERQNSWDIIDYIKNQLQNRYKDTDVQVFWERYGDRYESNTLIFSTIGESSFNCNFDEKKFSSTLVLVPDQIFLTNTENLISNNRPVRKERVDELNVNSFNKTNIMSPLITINNGYIEVFEDKGFIVKGISLTYIRKPQHINLSLSQSSELPEIVHQNLCDLVVDYIKLITQSPDWQLKKQDTLLNN